MLCISSFVSCCQSPPPPWLPYSRQLSGKQTGRWSLLVWKSRVQASVHCCMRTHTPTHTHALVYPRTSGRVPPTLFTPEAYTECTALNEEQELSVQFHDSSYLHPWAYNKELKKWYNCNLFWCHTAYTPVPLASYCVPMHKLFTYTQAHLCMNRHAKFALASTVI